MNGVPPFRRVSLLLVLASLLTPFAHGGFRDDFDTLTLDPTGAHGWTFRTGDGAATMTLTGGGGEAAVQVDATSDRRGIWWAFIRREITDGIDLAALARGGRELRVEARVRTSHGPRRINLHLNTQRTTNFHGNLLEFDLAEPGVWQTVSMTTHGFEARPGDRVAVQLALMDWGLERYRVDVDYIRVDVVDPTAAGPDLGDGVPYHPPVPEPSSLRHAVPAVASATIDRREPDANLADWSGMTPNGAVPVITTNGAEYAILRWDLSALHGRKVQGGGLLELKTHSVQRRAARTQDFGIVRVVEILGGNPDWTRETVTWGGLLQGRSESEVFNTQMIVDVEVNDSPGGSTLINLTRPVLQRLVDGRTRGIVLIPLGSINASFLPGSPARPEDAPTLRFNLAE